MNSNDLSASRDRWIAILVVALLAVGIIVAGILSYRSYERQFVPRRSKAFPPLGI